MDFNLVVNLSAGPRHKGFRVWRKNDSIFRCCAEQPQNMKHWLNAYLKARRALVWNATWNKTRYIKWDIYWYNEVTNQTRTIDGESGMRPIMPQHISFTRLAQKDATKVMELVMEFRTGTYGLHAYRHATVMLCYARCRGFALSSISPPYPSYPFFFYYLDDGREVWDKVHPIGIERTCENIRII